MIGSRNAASQAQKGRAAHLRLKRFCLIAGYLMMGVFAWAQAQVHDEQTVRSAFVFNLSKYVEWPHVEHDLVICFAGDGDMGQNLQKLLDGKAVDALIIRVLLLKPDDKVEPCDLLYVAYGVPGKTRAALDKVAGLNILTVGETESFTRNGGMVGLVRMGDQIKIEVNLELVQKTQLKISSRLLTLARIVSNSGGKG